jgi:hypothetical protein
LHCKEGHIVKSCAILSCADLVLDLESTWGDQHYIGLTGLEVVGRAGEVIPVDLSMIDAEPRDLHHLPGHEDDDRTLDK